MNIFTLKSCAKIFLSVIAAAAVFCPHVPALSAQDGKQEAAQKEASAPTSVTLKRPDRKMGLIASLEEAFDIMMDTDDIIDFGSYEKGKEILAKDAYGVVIE